jgi:hypothetical protein
VIHGDFRSSNILIDSVSGFIDLTSFKRLRVNIIVRPGF